MTNTRNVDSERRAFSNTRDSIGENLQELVEQTVVFPGKPPWTNIFREIGPIAVGADPDLHQRRLILDHRTMAGCREGRDALPRPDHRERPSHRDFYVVYDHHCMV